MIMEFHLRAKDRARHETSVKPESSIEVEIFQSAASGGQGGNFELELYRRSEHSQEWELVGTTTVGIGSRVRSVFEALERGSEYTIGVYYKHYGDAIDSELTVDGNVIVH
jgi:hypothetical protein